MVEMTGVRADLAAAHSAALDHLAAPGSWWTGEQRIELARTVLDALDDPDPPPPWIPISSLPGRVPADPAAPPAAHDAAHRVARHAATLTADWYHDVAASLGALPYVELVGIVSTTAALATFRRNAGLPPVVLPDPRSGEPTGDAPDAVVDAALNWVPVAAPADRTAAVVQAYSAVPGTFANLWRMSDAQYLTAAEMADPDARRRPDGLTRRQVELVAARVSQLRECFY